MAKLWARPVHGVLILAEGGGGGGGPWPYARSAPDYTPCDSNSGQKGRS